jgi:AcrR family transcriptional regulator
MDKTIFKLEREIIFDAALHLIKDGKYHPTTIREIAYHAGMSGITTGLLFPSKEILTSELVFFVRDRMQDVIEDGLAGQGSFKKQFFNAWRALYAFYIRHPEVLAFMEQNNSPVKFGNSRVDENVLLTPLIRFFGNGEATLHTMKPETLARFFHGNVMMCARMYLDESLPSDRADLQNAVDVLWNGLAFTSSSTFT